jgi:hypothetical protein
MSVLENPWGERYLDRYEKYFGSIKEYETYTPVEGKPSLQVFFYDNVVEDCKTIVTFGLSHYSVDIGMVTEIVCPISDAWYAVSFLLAAALSSIIKNKVPIGRGVCIDGITQNMPNFASNFNKDAIYFTSPFDFPKELQHLTYEKSSGHLLLAVLISRAEYLYIRQHGVDAFESLLEQSEADVYDLARASCV